MAQWPGSVLILRKLVFASFNATHIDIIPIHVLAHEGNHRSHKPSFGRTTSSISLCKQSASSKDELPLQDSSLYFLVLDASVLQLVYCSIGVNAFFSCVTLCHCHYGNSGRTSKAAFSRSQSLHYWQSIRVGYSCLIAVRVTLHICKVICHTREKKTFMLILHWQHVQ